MYTGNQALQVQGFGVTDLRSASICSFISCTCDTYQAHTKCTCISYLQHSSFKLSIIFDRFQNVCILSSDINFSMFGKSLCPREFHEFSYSWDRSSFSYLQELSTTSDIHVQYMWDTDILEHLLDTLIKHIPNSCLAQREWVMILTVVRREHIMSSLLSLLPSH